MVQIRSKGYWRHKVYFTPRPTKRVIRDEPRNSRLRIWSRVARSVLSHTWCGGDMSMEQ